MSQQRKARFHDTDGSNLLCSPASEDKPAGRFRLWRGENGGILSHASRAKAAIGRCSRIPGGIWLRRHLLRLGTHSHSLPTGHESFQSLFRKRRTIPHHGPIGRGDRWVGLGMAHGSSRQRSAPSMDGFPNRRTYGQACSLTLFRAEWRDKTQKATFDRV